MAYGLPARGEFDWDAKLVASIDHVKGVADAAETPTGAQAKADAAEADAVAAAATDATTKANQAETDANTYTDSELAAHETAKHDDSGWITLPLSAGWVTYDPDNAGGHAAPRYRKKNGRVEIQGLIKNGTIPATLATMPAGYRIEGDGPNINTHIFLLATATGYARVDVLSNGQIVVQTGGSSWLALDGISYFAD